MIPHIAVDIPKIKIGLMFLLLNAYIKDSLMDELLDESFIVFCFGRKKTR